MYLHAADPSFHRVNFLSVPALICMGAAVTCCSSQVLPLLQCLPTSLRGMLNAAMPLDSLLPFPQTSGLKQQ